MRIKDTKEGKAYRQFVRTEHVPKSKNDIGKPIPFYDYYGHQLAIGDRVMYRNNLEESRILWNPVHKCFCLYRGLWYHPFNKYDWNSYGKVDAELTAGERMNIVKIFED